MCACMCEVSVSCYVWFHGCAALLHWQIKPKKTPVLLLSGPCVWFRMINHIPFLSGDSSLWQQIWFWPLKSRHVVERRLQDLSVSMPLKENVWMGLLIRKQLEAIPHRHEISMHLLCKSQTDWRRCEAGSVPITQWAKCSEWLTMIKCKRLC